MGGKKSENIKPVITTQIPFLAFMRNLLSQNKIGRSAPPGHYSRFSGECSRVKGRTKGAFGKPRWTRV